MSNVLFNSCAYAEECSTNLIPSISDLDHQIVESIVNINDTEIFCITMTTSYVTTDAINNQHTFVTRYFENPNWATKDEIFVYVAGATGRIDSMKYLGSIIQSIFDMGYMGVLFVDIYGFSNKDFGVDSFSKFWGKVLSLIKTEIDISAFDDNEMKFLMHISRLADSFGLHDVSASHELFNFALILEAFIDIFTSENRFLTSETSFSFYGISYGATILDCFLRYGLENKQIKVNALILHAPHNFFHSCKNLVDMDFSSRYQIRPFRTYLIYAGKESVKNYHLLAEAEIKELEELSDNVIVYCFEDLNHFEVAMQPLDKLFAELN